MRSENRSKSGSIITPTAFPVFHILDFNDTAAKFPLQRLACNPGIPRPGIIDDQNLA